MDWGEGKGQVKKGPAGAGVENVPQKTHASDWWVLSIKTAETCGLGGLTVWFCLQ